MTPLFGVAFGAVLLGEPVSAAFLVAALAVAGGIVLVNLPARQVQSRSGLPSQSTKSGR
jgi:drug/metabolite transporter (DMT)-like permease